MDTLTDVALSVFRDRGYDATSMEHLASAAGISKAAFYHHIGGKEELLSRGLDRALSALSSVLTEAEATTGPAVDRLRFVLGRVVTLVHKLLPEVTVLLRTRGNSNAERAAVSQRRAFDRSVGALVASAQQQGDIRSDIDPQLAARLVIGMANSVTEWYRPKGRLGAEQLAEHIVTMALKGLAVPPLVEANLTA